MKKLVLYGVVVFAIVVSFDVGRRVGYQKATDEWEEDIATLANDEAGQKLVFSFYKTTKESK
jgi:hypothetical protein